MQCATHVAKKFIELQLDCDFSTIKEDEITIYKINMYNAHALTIIAHGHHLALHDEYLISDDIHCGNRTLVIPEVIRDFNLYGRTLYGVGHGDFSENQLDTITQVYNCYGHYESYQLKNILTKKDSPFYKFTKSHSVSKYFNINEGIAPSAILPDDYLKDHYNKILS